jgi:hypothetical protein
MYRADDGLTCLGELLEKSYYGVRRLRIEARGRLVKEQEKRRLGSQLDTNGEPFSLLHSERHDDRVLNFVQLQELNCFVDVGQLFLLRDISVLS